MNEKVKEFIGKMNAVEKADKNKKKEELLKTLGLGEVKVIRKCSKTWVDDYMYDASKDIYYKDEKTFVPIEVTDEEYREILKYEHVYTNQDKDKNVGYSIASVISVLVKVITIICVIGGLIGILNHDIMGISICVLIGCGIYYPFLMGFAKIVEAAEKYLKAK